MCDVTDAPLPGLDGQIKRDERGLVHITGLARWRRCQRDRCRGAVRSDVRDPQFSKCRVRRWRELLELLTPTREQDARVHRPVGRCVERASLRGRVRRQIAVDSLSELSDCRTRAAASRNHQNEEDTRQRMV
jgi:hypothetical protein